MDRVKIDLRPPADDNELEALLAVIRQSFTSPTDATAYVDQVGMENFRAAWLDGRVVGALATFWMGHWFGSRSVPVCGVAAVGVRPELRGTGLGTQMMRATLAEARERGVALASLYASTQAPYRRVGYEQAGVRNRYTLALRELRSFGRELPVHAVDATEESIFRPLYARWARRQSGVLDRSDGIWKRVHRGEHTYAVVVGDRDDPEGYLIWSQVTNDTMFYDIAVRDRVALTPAASRQLWTVIADHRSMASRVFAAGSAMDPWFAQLDEWRSVTTTVTEPWLMRIVDVQRAFEERGWAPGVGGRLDLDLADVDFPANAGRWQVEVGDGRATVRRGGTGAIRLDRRGLAPLYTGAWTATQLAAQGFLSGGQSALQTADRLFVGPAPWIVDHF